MLALRPPPPPPPPPRVVLCTCQRAMSSSQPRGDPEGQVQPEECPSSSLSKMGSPPRGIKQGARLQKWKPFSLHLALVDFTRALWAVMLITH